MKKALTIGVIILFFAMTVTPIVNSSCITTATHGPSKTIDNKDTQTLSNENISVDISLTATKIRWRTWRFETTLQNTGNTTVTLGYTGKNAIYSEIGIAPRSNWTEWWLRPTITHFSIMPKDYPVEIHPGEKINLPDHVWRGWIEVWGPRLILTWTIPGPAVEYVVAASSITADMAQESVDYDRVTISLSGIFGR